MAYQQANHPDRLLYPMIRRNGALERASWDGALDLVASSRWQGIRRARDRGARIIVVDPRETPIARTADLWLPIRPGGDAALLNAMLRILTDDGLVDEKYLRARTNGWDDVRAAAGQLSLEETVKITGIPTNRILAAARLYGSARTSLIVHARGIEHSSHGVDNCLVRINLALARGQVGKRAAPS